MAADTQSGLIRKWQRQRRQRSNAHDGSNGVGEPKTAADPTYVETGTLSEKDSAETRSPNRNQEVQVTRQEEDVPGPRVVRTRRE